MGRPSLYIIDGHAQIYRAYYAPFRNLTAPSGEPTRATYVFCQMLLNILRDRKPDYLVMALDVSDETVFRVEIDPDYKAHRDPPPEDLTPQKNRIIHIVETLGIPIIRINRFEADDIMATLAARHGGKDADVYLVSKDKDLEQLLTDGIYMYDVGKDRVIDAATMERDKGYPPAKAVEAQMLIGDSVDNIKGVKGVGPKKAAELLGKYGTVAGIIEAADELTPKLRENMLEFAGRAGQVRQLVTLKTDMDFAFDLADAATSKLRGDAVRPVFQALNFNRLTDQLTTHFGLTADAPSAAADLAATDPASASGSAAQATRGGAPKATGDGAAARGAKKSSPMSLFDEAEGTLFATVVARDSEADRMAEKGHYRLVDDEAGLRELVAALKGVREFAFDTETTSLNPVDADLVGISMSWQAGEAWYVATGGVGRHLSLDIVRARLGPVFANEKIAKCGQNVKYDMGVMETAGMPVRGARFDSMLASFVLDATRRSHGIDALALDFFGIRKIPTSDLIGSGSKQITFDKLKTTEVCPYACEDADVAWRLRERLAPDIESEGLSELYNTLEMPLVEVLATIERHGVSLDTELLGGLSREFEGRLKGLTLDIHDAAGRPFNIDSTKQLAEVLFDDLGLKAVRKTKTGRSTDAAVLKELAEKHDALVPKLVLEYRELSKLKSTYIDALPRMVSPRTGRVHCSFHQTGAVTGRLSSSDPNLQNIPIRTDTGARIRRAFVARAKPGERVKDWTLIASDYSQIELRVLAHFSQDENLIQAFRDDRDIHQFVASQVFDVPLDEVTKEQRGRAKTVNFGIIYGQTAFGLSRQTSMSVSEAREFISAYFRRYPRIQGFMDECIEFARNKGYVQTMLGRRRRIDEIESRNPNARAQAERLAVNTVVQGTAADIIKRAMINIHRRLIDESRPTRMLIQVHDELVFECPTAALKTEAAMIAHEMSSAIPLDVPLKVDVAAGPNWLDMEDA